jgi:hypothetical protein
MPGRPALIIGSIVKIIPGCSLRPSRAAIVQDLRLLVELAADADRRTRAPRKSRALGMALDRRADVTQRALALTSRMPRHIASKVTSHRRFCLIAWRSDKNMRRYRRENRP